jgi:hypothetical protein
MFDQQSLTQDGKEAKGEPPGPPRKPPGGPWATAAPARRVVAAIACFIVCDVVESVVVLMRSQCSRTILKKQIIHKNAEEQVGIRKLGGGIEKESCETGLGPC